MYRMYKYRLCPNKTQIAALQSSLETHRRVYNSALADRIAEYQISGKTLRQAQQYKVYAAKRNVQIKDLKDGKDGPHWMAHIAAVSMRDTIKRLDKAFDAFFRRIKRGEKPGFPRFRGRDRYDSIPFDNYDSGCVLIDPSGRSVYGVTDGGSRGYKLRMFGIGSIKVRLHRPVQGTIKTATVCRESDHWYVVFSCVIDDQAPRTSTNPPIGIDVGLESFYTTSDGEHEPNPRFLKKVLPKLRRVQRSLSRKQKDGKNRTKCKKRVSRMHAKVKNCRKEFHHQSSLRLVRRYGVICAEDLNVKEMIKNGKFSRSISDAGWSGFLMTLACKAESAGVSVVKVDPRGTSQECSGCGEVVPKDITVRKHDCPHCGLKLHRDVNAARNILARGLARTGPAGDNVGHEAERTPRSPNTTDVCERLPKTQQTRTKKTPTARGKSAKSK